MNMFKSNGGFTLVELIVVIAILAILAGVAVPAYSGYISKANEAADQTALDGVKTAVNFAAMEQDADHVLTITQIVYDGTTTAEITGTGLGADGTATTADVNFSEYSTAPTLKSGSTATWSSSTGKWEITGTPASGS